MPAFAGKGFATIAERHSGLQDNFSYGRVTEDEIAAMTRAALGEARPDAVIYFCTNFAGASVAPLIEIEFGIPVLDSTALGVWGALRAANRKLSGLARWGRLFEM